MWKISSLIVLIVLGLCCMSSAFLVKSSQPDLLLYFDKVVVSVKGTGQEAKYHTLEFANNNTVVTYNVISGATNKDFNITLDFSRSEAGSTDLTVTALNMTLTVTSTPRSYFTLSSVQANIVGTTQGNAFGGDNLRLISQIKLEAPLTNSFHCGKYGKLYPAFVEAVKGDNSTIPFVEFHGLQMQAFNVTNDKFGHPWDCVGYFSAGILSGIFILAILIGVVTWGIAMIMDVKTMDRFDDPKGKPISFGGAE